MVELKNDDRSQLFALALYKILILIVFYELGTIIYVLLKLKTFFFTPSFVLLVSVFLFFSWPIIRKRFTFYHQLLIACVHFGITIWINYELVGKIDLQFGGLKIYDSVFLKWESNFFVEPLGLFLEKFLLGMGYLSVFVFDYLVVSYIIYFVLPFLVLFFLLKDRDLNHYLGRYAYSFILMYFINFILYLSVPVMGPQHFIGHYYAHKLPFSFIGNFIYKTIAQLRPTYIDCFPSGHGAVGILSTLWAFSVKIKYRYLILVLALSIIFSTIILRYHYVIDLVLAIPLAVGAYLIACKVVDIKFKIEKKR